MSEPKPKASARSSGLQPQSGHRGGPALGVAVGLVALILGMALGLKIGAGVIPISWSEIFTWLTGGVIDEGHEIVLRQVRAPRVLLAVLAGAVLATAGVVYQAILRNPLAGPYTLGVAGGATLGAVASIALMGAMGTAAAVHSLPVISVAALAGSVVAIALIYALANSAGRFSSATLILAGVTLNLVFASMILLIQYLADYTQVYEMIRWMMGGLDIVGYQDFMILAPVSIAGFVVILLGARDLDLLAVDPTTAATLGVRVESVRWRLLLGASLMTGCVVAFAGPIAFVGLIVPHCVRMLVGASHARVLPASAITGALFLLACDTAAQNILGGEELPVGVITAMLGGPFFVYLLLARRGGGMTWG